MIGTRPITRGAPPAPTPAPAFALALALLCTAGRAPAADGPQHVMSLSMCTDDLLLELLPPERIASVSYYSRDRSNSYQWPQAAKVRINWGTVEEVLAEKPDLVLAGTYTTPAARSLLKKLRWPLLEVPPAADFDEIRAVTRLVAHALRRDAVGESLIAKMDSTLQELAASKPPQIIRVAAWGEGRSIPGKGTLFDAILTAAGGVSATEPGDGAGGGFMALISSSTPKATGQLWEIKCAVTEPKPLRGIWVEDGYRTKPSEMGNASCVAWTWDNVAAFIDSL